MTREVEPQDSARASSGSVRNDEDFPSVSAGCRLVHDAGTIAHAVPGSSPPVSIPATSRTPHLAHHYPAQQQQQQQQRHYNPPPTSSHLSEAVPTSGLLAGTPVAMASLLAPHPHPVGPPYDASHPQLDSKQGHPQPVQQLAPPSSSPPQRTSVADGGPKRGVSFADKQLQQTNGLPPRSSLNGYGAPPYQAVEVAAPPPPAASKQAVRHEEHREVAAAVIFSPKETYDHIVAAGVSKTQLTLGKQVTLGVLAGFYISFSFILCMMVGGQIPTIQHEHPGLYSFILGSVGFPLGLTIIMVVGADLFTSSCMYMMTAWLEGRVAFYYVIKNWIITWWCNLAGCLIMAQLVTWSGLFAGAKSDFPIYLAHKKTSATFGQTVVKGILCNWLVNLAVWMANSARDVTGKAVGVYLPVSAFVTLGTEHVIANQFQLSFAKMLGSGISVHTIVCSNWIPTTIGNIIGGAFFVGTLYAGAYGTLYDRMWLRTLQIYVFILPKSVRERIAAAHQSVHDTIDSWVDWDAIITPACELTARQAAAAAAAKSAAPPSRSVSSALMVAATETPRRLVSAAAAAMRNPPMTPFEKRRSNVGLGSDVV